MRLPFRSIRTRLAVIIVLAMTALVALLVYQELVQRADERQEAEDNLERLAYFAAYAQRERFDAAERLLVLASQSPQLRAVALDPNDTEAFDACTRTLYVLDQLLPGTRFNLWDTDGDSLCSSLAAKPGEFSAADKLWFTTAAERGGFATGGYEVTVPGGEPSLGLGIPIRDAAGEQVLAYLSTALLFESGSALVEGATLPETGRLSVIDQESVVVASTELDPGERLPAFGDRFGGLQGYLSSATAEGDTRFGAAVRITDADDAFVIVVVSAEKSALAPGLLETLIRGLTPVLIVTALTLVAVWLLAQRWIVTPVRALVDASAAIARGQLGARAKVSRDVSEFEHLGLAFNEMASTREQATRAKDEFLGLVSHELKTPITMAMGNAAVLKQHGDRLEPEQRREALDDIYDSTARLTAIIDNLLALARLERGAELESEPLALFRLAQRAADDCRRNAPNRVVHVTGDETLFAIGGETYVGQVLSNLIGNAFKYSPDDQPVDVRISAEDGQAVVRVSDRGLGISEEEREAVFQPFFRSAKTAAYAEGVGIGLSVCKRLIEAMGGKIWCAPRAEGGTEFGFTLPLADGVQLDPAEPEFVPVPAT